MASNNALVQRFTSHLRAFRSQIDECEPTEAEGEVLDKAGITNAKARSYLIWRRSCLAIASPFVNTSMILGLVSLRDLASVGDVFNALGNFMMFLVSIDSLFMNVGMSLSMYTWANANLSIRSLRYGWLLSFAVPLVPALFPIEALLKKDAIKEFEDTTEDPDNAFLLLKITIALMYVIQLLPVIITFPGGAVRGALRILGLLPNSSLPGWILMVAAPFYSLLVCVVLIVVIQVIGNGTIFFGTLFLVAAPLVYIVRGRLFVTDKQDKHEYQIKMTQRVSALITALGLFLLLIWAFTAQSHGLRVMRHRKNDEVDALLTYGQGIRKAFEMVGRLLVTTVLFSDLVLAMTICHWRENKMSQVDEETGNLDMFHLNTFLNSAKPVDAIPGSMADAGDLPPVLPFDEAEETSASDDLSM